MSRCTPSRLTSGTVSGLAPGDLVDLVEEDDAAGFHPFQGHARHLVHVDEFLFLFLHQVIQRFGHAHFAALALLAEDVGQHVLEVDAHFLDAGVGGDLERGRAVLDVDLHDAFVEFAFPQALAEFLAGALDGLGGLGLLGHEQVEQPVLGAQLGAVGHFVQALFAHHVDGDVHQVADHGFHVAAHVAHFGELAGFHLEKRRIGEPGQAARQFGFADAGGPDHENVLGHHLVGHFGRQFLAADAVAQRDRHGALSFGLAHDVLVQLAHDLARRELVQDGLLVRGLAGKVDHHGYSSSSKVTFSLV